MILAWGTHCRSSNINGATVGLMSTNMVLSWVTTKIEKNDFGDFGEKIITTIGNHYDQYKH